MNQLTRLFFEAFAVGDAMGMPTEFMTRQEIARQFGEVETLLPPAKTSLHPDLPAASITDDTEQNVYLYSAYTSSGKVDVDITVAALQAWIVETDAIEKKYIGPSSLKALTDIQNGVDPRITGLSGTTCGGIMRIPSVVLWKPEQTEAELEENIVLSLMPTHYTSTALEAAGAYAFALRAALHNYSRDDILAAAIEGGSRLASRAPGQAYAPSSVARIKQAYEFTSESDEDLVIRLSDVWGCGLPSADVCGAVFSLVFHSPDSVWKAIRLAAILGGDTDTIAALAAGLIAMVNRKHDIPDTILKTVLETNVEIFGQKLDQQI